MTKHQMNLVTLNLSGNLNVNDNFVKDLCVLFTAQSTLVHLYLDKTAIRIRGFKKLLESCKVSLKVRTISVNECRLELYGENAKDVIDIM